MNNYGNRLSGKPFRTRVRKSMPPLTQDRPISGLPRNIYSPDFLSTRRSDLLNHLDVQDPIELPVFENDPPHAGPSILSHTKPSRPAALLRSSRALRRRTTPLRRSYYQSDTDDEEST
ncbi:hypothetical protein C0992_009506 [Termitomyces sp. T32_za158]|nr:hypothetical protein C0992_009506 [Termitomyces sp. T32_za158]